MRPIDAYYPCDRMCRRSSEWICPGQQRNARHGSCAAVSVLQQLFT